MTKRKNSSLNKENVKMKDVPKLKKYSKELKENENAADRLTNDVASPEAEKRGQK